ncbi:MAG: Fic family protein [Alistipes sp.]
MKYIDLEEYIRQGEPQKREKGIAWQTAIGLQEVDGLKPSEYLIQTAQKHIEGDITIEEAKVLVDSYYQSKPATAKDDNRTEEADKVSARIAEILSEKSFSFSLIEYITIHRRLFEGIYKFAGEIRDYNISKKEWVLNSESVTYGNAINLRETLQFDIEQEKKFSYKGLSIEQTVSHLTKFVADLWQIHPFGEGNTRTTALFVIKYLRTLGFEVNNDTFAAHSWYFRNALVRANYNNIKLGVTSTTRFLEQFFRNLLMNETVELKNRELHIEFKSDIEVKNNSGTVNGTVNGTVKMIKENPKITLDELAEAIGKSRRTVARQIKQLQEDGVIRRVGSDKTGYWEVIK